MLDPSAATPVCTRGWKKFNCTLLSFIAEDLFETKAVKAPKPQRSIFEQLEDDDDDGGSDLFGQVRLVGTSRAELKLKKFPCTCSM